MNPANPINPVNQFFNFTTLHNFLQNFTNFSVAPQVLDQQSPRHQRTPCSEISECLPDFG